MLFAFIMIYDRIPLERNMKRNARICQSFSSLGLIFFMLFATVAPVFSAENTGLVCEFRPVQVNQPFGAELISKASESMQKKLADSTCPDEIISFAVSGKANFPGVFEMCRPVNVLSAVLLAGGPAVDGSMRRISVFHEKTQLGEFDLYDFIRNESLKGDFILNGGEVIKIEPAGPRVSISGRVVAPAVYELRENELNLAAAISNAGGFFPASGSFHIEVLRKIDERQSCVATFDVLPGNAVPDFTLLSGDEICVLMCIASDKQVISIEGQAEEYKAEFSPGMRISDTLINHVRFKNGAALDYAELLREGGPDMTYLVHGFSPSDILSGNPASDVALQAGDRLIFFSESFLRRPAIVAVSGKVQKPSNYLLKEGMSVADLLKQCGANRLPDAEKLELTRRRISHGKLEMTKLEISIPRALSGDPAHNLPLQPFDLLHIP